MLRFAPGLLTAVRKPPRTSSIQLNIRLFHDTVADFTSQDQRGKLITSKVPIKIGEPHESYVMIPPAVGRALQSCIALDTSALDASPTDVYTLEKHQLTFFYSSLHFGHGSPSEYPRLKLPNNLPAPKSLKKAPATLYLVGYWHTIALDGTEDGVDGDDSFWKERSLNGCQNDRTVIKV